MKLALAVFVLPLFLAGGGSVTPGPALNTPRAAHTATLLQSGKVLVAGGCTVDSCELDAEGATTELYDPAGNRFERGPRMTRPRVSHTASRLPNGDVLLAGGWDGDRTDCDRRALRRVDRAVRSPPARCGRRVAAR